MYQRRRNPLDDLEDYLGQPQTDPRQAVRQTFGPPAQSDLVTSRASQGRATERALTSARAPRGRGFVTIEIDGFGPLEVGTEFRRLSPAQQQAAINEAISARPEPQGYDASLVSQGLSGTYEGQAGTVGLPVDLATSALNLVPAGIDAVAGTNLGRIPNDTVLSSEWLRRQGRNAGIIRPESSDPTSQFVRRTMQSVGGASIPVAATASSGAQLARGLLPALVGGAAASGARQAFPGNPLVEMGAELVGSALTGAGMYGMTRRQAGRVARAAVPTTDQLREQASDLYARAESRGVVAGPDVTTNIADRARRIATRAALITPTGRVNGAYPRAAETLNLLDDYAGHDLNPTQMQVIRETLTDAVSSTRGRERRISTMMLRAFDDATVPLAPELAQARAVSSRYLQADRIAQARELAAQHAAQHPTVSSAQALRQEFGSLDKAIIKEREHFNPAVRDAISTVSRGTRGSNAARMIGRLAPATPASLGITSMAPFGLGYAAAGPGVGSILSGGTMAVGMGGRAVSNRMTENAAAMADLIARNGGRLNVNAPPAQEAVRQLLPSLMGQTAPRAAQELPQFMRGMNDDFVRPMAASEPGQPEYEDEESRRRRLLGLPRY